MLPSTKSIKLRRAEGKNRDKSNTGYGSEGLKYEGERAGQAVRM